MSAGLRLTMVAAEASGDLLAAHLIEALQVRWPQLQADGIGGPEMAARGFDAQGPIAKLSVRGYLEVLPRLPELLRIRRQLGAHCLAEPPDLFIGVDAPDFNFGLETRLREAGIKTLHFVSPSFWAWRAERLSKLKAAADHVLCLFPFEPELLAAHGICATYVGHPLAATIAMQPDRLGAREQLDLSVKAPIVALLPGSRAGELRHMAPRFLQAAGLLRQTRPHLRFVWPVVPHLIDEARAMAAGSGLGDALLLLQGQSHPALAACDVALVASGTATLETALFKRPMVIAYAMSDLSLWLMRRHRQQLAWVGLPNILCAPRAWLAPSAGMAPGAPFVVPELIQDAATPPALADAVADWLDHPEKVRSLEARFTELHQELKQPTAQLAADVVQKLVGR